MLQGLNHRVKDKMLVLSYCLRSYHYSLLLEVHYFIAFCSKLIRYCTELLAVSLPLSFKHETYSLFYLLQIQPTAEINTFNSILFLPLPIKIRSLVQQESKWRKLHKRIDQNFMISYQFDINSYDLQLISRQGISSKYALQLSSKYAFLNFYKIFNRRACT